MKFSILDIRRDWFHASSIPASDAIEDIGLPLTHDWLHVHNILQLAWSREFVTLASFPLQVHPDIHIQTLQNAYLSHIYDSELKGISEGLSGIEGYIIRTLSIDLFLRHDVLPILLFRLFIPILLCVVLPIVLCSALLSSLLSWPGPSWSPPEDFCPPLEELQQECRFRSMILLARKERHARQQECILYSIYP